MEKEIKTHFCKDCKHSVIGKDFPGSSEYLKHIYLNYITGEKSFEKRVQNGMKQTEINRGFCSVWNFEKGFCSVWNRDGLCKDFEPKKAKQSGG